MVVFIKKNQLITTRILETVIFAAVAIAIVILFSLGEQPFRTESLLLAVLIFGIYLIVFKKIKDFKFSDFEIRLTDAENKPLVESSFSKPFEDDAHSHYFETAKSGGGTEKLEKVLPVVSADLKYEGIIDRETIANQIYDELSELSQYKIKPIA